MGREGDGSCIEDVTQVRGRWWVGVCGGGGVFWRVRVMVGYEKYGGIGGTMTDMYIFEWWDV